jgi:hypothetical protein
MADNIDVSPGTGKTIAADDIGGVLYQRAKVTWGPDGTANDTDVATGKPLPVQLRSSTGTDLIGTAGAASAAVVTVQGTASGTAQPVSGSLTTVSTVTSLTQMNGAAISMGTGVRGAGVQRVTIATDDVVPVTNTPLTNFGAGEYETVAASQTAQASGSDGRHRRLYFRHPRDSGHHIAGAGDAAR